MITFVIASVFLALNLGTFWRLLFFSKIVNHSLQNTTVLAGFSHGVGGNKRSGENGPTHH
jgi:hypothetical protein